MDMKEIIIKVSDLTGISVADMLSKNRTLEVCQARRIFIYISYKKLLLSHTTIGEFLDRTQQTISNQITVFNEQMSIYKDLKKNVDVIEDKIFTSTL